MERAPLRPVPARPAGPVDPAAAIREVTAVLPTLAPLEARALALVALADRPRPQVADLLGIEEQQLGAVLAAARGAAQTITPLSGSGWCERAEGLISDRLDGAVLAATRAASTSTCATARAASSTSAAWCRPRTRCWPGWRHGAPGRTGRRATALVPVDDTGLLEDEALKVPRAGQAGATPLLRTPPPPTQPAQMPPALAPRASRARMPRARARMPRARAPMPRARAPPASTRPLRRRLTRSRPPPRFSSQLARAASSPRPSLGTRWWPSR